MRGFDSCYLCFILPLKLFFKLVKPSVKINIIKNQKSKKSTNHQKQFLTLSQESQTTNLPSSSLNSINVIVRSTKRGLRRKRQLKKLQYGHNLAPKPMLRVLKS